MKRIFLAIKADLCDEYSMQIQRLKLELKEEQIRWVAPQNYHFTLHFFGNTDVESEEKLIGLLAAFVEKESSFSLNLGSFGVFKKRRSPKVLFIDVQNAERLKDLVNNLQSVLVEHGFPGAEKSFRPHLTIARIRNIENKARLVDVIERIGGLPGQAVKVDQLILYESILKPEGPQYKPIQLFELNG